MNNLGQKEPLIHSHITGGLDEKHPLAYSCVSCKRCKDTVHTYSNKCMTSWVETGKGNFCFKCFMILLKQENSIEAMSEEDGWEL